MKFALVSLMDLCFEVAQLGGGSIIDSKWLWNGADSDFSKSILYGNV